MSSHPIACFLILCLIPLSLQSTSVLPRDYDAVLRIFKELAIRPAPAGNLCAAAGIFCGGRLVNESLGVRVTRLVLEKQDLRGELSPALGALSELVELSLPNNQLIGQIPAQIKGCKKLQFLILRNNRLSGKIPPEFSSLAHLRVLDLSSNKLEGDLMFLGHFPDLERLNLADNLFAGKLPESLRSSLNLRFINISGNSLVEGVSEPQDKYLAARLSGKMETSTRRYIFSETSQGTAAESKSNHNRVKKVLQWIKRFSIGILLGGATGFILSALVKLFVGSAEERETETSLKIFSTKIKRPVDLDFLEKEDALESLEVIGSGACGEVYKASLTGGTRIEIAIKKISQLPTETEEIREENSKMINKKLRQIRAEVRTMGQMRHPNLLPLLAYLHRPGCHYLVFEYMKNGSLQDYLRHAASGQRELPWLTRYNIALGVAKGLEYLHGYSPRVIHRDLKPANVLLDDKMEAKITDFGFAKALPDADTHCSTSNVAGTVGYIAPEYYQTFTFTDKCDIFSFGVLLGVLVTGKFPTDEFFRHTEELSLVRWMRRAMASEEPKTVIDPNLLGNEYEEQMVLVLKVACFCTRDDPKERPTSRDARCMLHQVKHH